MRSLLRSTQVSSVEPSDRDSAEDDAEAAEEQPKTPPPEDNEDWLAMRGPSTMTPSATKLKFWERGQLKEDMMWPRDTLDSSEADIVDRGLITMEVAEELLGIYRNELVKIWPKAVIPPDWSARDLRTRKPALFHAIMAAASHSKGAALSDRLNEEVVHLYAKSLFIKGEKSLQYIQALLVTVAYYTPPPLPAQHQVFQYGNMAASMALELGLAYKPRTHEQLPKRAIRSLQRISSPEELLENCRTILMLYIVTAGFATRLRRPNILVYNSWMEESLSLLQKSPLLDDKRFVVWLKLQRILDEGMSAFGFDDASTSFSLSELRIQVILRVFERRMQKWIKSVPSDIMTLPFMLEYHQNEITMWEFAMDGGRYDAPVFRNTHLTLPSLDDDCVQPESLLSRSALQINATIKCVSAAQSLLDSWIQIPIATLQKVPNPVFIRAVYAIVVLLKIDYAVGTDAEGIGELIDSQSLKIPYYLDTVLHRTDEAVGGQKKCMIPAHWLFIMKKKIKTWHDEHQEWRKRGGNTSRQPPSESSSVGVDSSVTLTDTSKAAPAAQSVPATSFTRESVMQNQASNYGMNSTYSRWPDTASLPSLPGQTFTSDQAVFPGEIPDFAAAFQNGDLYFLNDVTDNFGGWMPPGAIDGEMQYGTINTGF
jgi:hypothetical protein